MNTKREPRVPFLVTGGDCKEIILRIIESNTQAHVAMAAFAEKYGASKFYSTTRLEGLIFDSEIPKGWVHRKKDLVGAGTPKTKKIKEELAALPEMCDTRELQEALNCPMIPDTDNKYRWPYFEHVGDLLIHKKGTTHITFSDEDLLKRFNIYGCQHKSWLPPTYGRKAYEDLGGEEKAVIDDYEGEQSYKETLHKINSETDT